MDPWVGSLGLEDPLEEGVATHSSILAWRIPRDRGAWGGKESDMTEQLSTAQLQLLEREKGENNQEVFHLE